MIKDICIFEDRDVDKLHPLTLTRPVYDLRCGFSSLKEKVMHQFPLSAVALHCRKYLEDCVAEDNPGTKVNQLESDECLFINGRTLVNSYFLQDLDTNRECLYVAEGQIAAALLRGENLKAVRFGDALDFESVEKNVERCEVEANLLAYPWHLIHNNAAEIVYDFGKLKKAGEIHGAVSEHAVLLNREQIYIGHNSVIKAGVVLDAEAGPIYIGSGVTVMANAVILGPCFIGNKSQIKIGAKIYSGCSIGEVCKVGGEVDETIIHSHSNKQHDGFLGHAYLGQWVNLGADTNNSDLKNNYSNVKVMVQGKPVDSGSMFVGLFMGDHSKTGINTMFNTGTVVGAMSNVFGAGLPPKYIPSFSWGGSQGLTEHHIDKAIETARAVMARRKVTMTDASERMLRHVHELTKPERA